MKTRVSLRYFVSYCGLKAFSAVILVILGHSIRFKTFDKNSGNFAAMVCCAVEN